MRFDSNRLWGVEIEFLATVSREDVAKKMTEKGVPCYVEGYNHTTRKHWKVVSDASCGYELVSPPLKGEDGFRQLKIACEVLNELGAKVDKRCGLHVHHDANDFTINTFKRVLALYAKYEDAIDQLLPPSRRGDFNRYCGSLLIYDKVTTLREIGRKTSVDALMRLYFNNRYFKINLQSYLRHGTIEFRHHSGTIEYEKIKHWVVLTQAIINRAIDAPVQYSVRVANYRTFKEALGACGSGIKDEHCREAIKYFDARWKHFAVREGRVAV